MHEGKELSLVPSLQAAVEEALLARGVAGAVVALDPNDGSVLALFSVPGDRGDPLVTPHKPASTFKAFTAIAALRAGVITPEEVFTCSGHYDVAGVRLTCPREHGTQNVARALATSCNAFFYEVGARLDPAALADTAREFGLASPSGIELADPGGRVPDAPSKREKETPRELIAAIGHADYRVNLLGLARGYAAIVNGGKVPELHLVRDQLARDRGVKPVGDARPRMLALDASTLDPVRSGFVAAVAAEYGAAHSAAIRGVAFAGKTGGADSPPRTAPGAGDAPVAEERDSWFVAYAPPIAPKILIAARLERITDENNAAKLVARLLASLPSEP